MSTPVRGNVAFQSTSLVAAGLGIPDGTETHGPRLAEGIHLRWQFEREVGFPWHGFHVFRRMSSSDKERELAWDLSREKVGDTGHRIYSVPDFGTCTSDRNLVIADAWNGGPQGFDLGEGSRLSWSLQRIVHRVTVVVDLRDTAAVEVEAYSRGQLLARKYASGRPGGTASVTFEFDTITDIVLSGSSATHWRMVINPVAIGAELGWQELQAIRYPLRLPLAHPAYPPPQGITSVTEAHDIAMKRVAGAGDFTDPSWVEFEEMHEQLANLAEEVASGGQMVDRVVRVQDSDGTGEQANVAVAMLQRPLDLILLSCLDPTIAQMVGLYWVDTTAQDRTVYDYLVVADHSNPEGFVRAAVLGEGLHPADIPNTDTFITFGHSLMDVQPLAAPGRVELYALPDAGGRAAAVDEEHATGLNRVGVRWNLGALSGTALHPGQPAMFRLLRADLGEAAPNVEPEVGEFEAITESPIVVARPFDASVASGRPDGWPNVRLLAVDAGLPDGWYSYRAAGVDLFGRQSPPSAPGRWWQWTPAPQPRPWYYQPPAAYSLLHDYAVCLRDETPPPAPIAVEAEALDPAADQQWREDLAAHHARSLVGVRVRWSWPARLERQAPDVVEFRVYYQAGMLNVLRGTVVAVVAEGTDESVVVTDIADDLPTDAYEGLSVRISAGTHRIVGSASSGTLELRVNDGGDRPEAGTPCAIGLRPGHLRYIDYYQPDNWQTHFYTVPVGDHARVETVGGETVSQYEVRLPELDAGMVEGLPIEATLADPVVYAHLGVTAVRDDPEPVELPDPAGGAPIIIDEFHTESPVGNPVPVYVVLRDKPKPPAPPHVDGEELLATRADYHGHSYFSHRWKPAPHMRAHVYRALDDAVFRTDLQLRPRGHLDPHDQADTALFPDDWGAIRVDHVVLELNELDDLLGGGVDDKETQAAYRRLSSDAVRVLAGLPGNEKAFSQRTIEPLDPNDAATANRRGPDDPDDYQPDDDLRCYIDKIDGRSSSRFLYRTAYVDPAQNRSDLGLAGAPVATPKVTPPRAPAVAKVKLNDGQATLMWRSSREHDVVEYRVYRAERETNAADLRLMQLLHTEAVESEDPAERPSRVHWTDDTLVGGHRYWYRLTAMDAVGNVSKPSTPTKVKAVDTRPPEPPFWESATWLLRDDDGHETVWTPDEGEELPDGYQAVLRLEWRSDVPAARFTLTRRRRGAAAWQAVHIGDTLQTTGPGAYQAAVSHAPHRDVHDYRIVTVALSGVASVAGSTLRVGPAPSYVDAEADGAIDEDDNESED